MLRTKKDVDRHVQDIFRKLPNEHERTLRCYKIAELYFHVGDYESARRYLSQYVEVRKEAKAHKLMGQILEALGNKENALVQYKHAFELDGRQEDLILKVCELMADYDIEIDVNRAKYWIERADKLFPKNKIVFQLKEKILSIERPTNNTEDLENLIKAELSVRPTDVQLRVKLLKHYMEKNKMDDAYKHAVDVERTNIHRNNLIWYQVLCELFLKCKNNKQSNWSFWISYISALEHCAALALKEQGSLVKKSSEAMQAVYNFDQHLTEAKAQSLSSYQSLTESIFMHMWGQLHFHMACLLLQNTQRDQSSWSEAARLSAPLLLTAVHIKPIDLTASWAMQADSSIKSQLQIWYREGSYRCSQAGHVLRDYSRGNQKKLISDIEKFCIGSWRERIYQRIFVGKIYQKVRSSYFTNNNGLYPPLRLISNNELKRFDEVAEEVWPYSLHHQIWPAVKIRNSNSLYSNKQEGLQPNLSSHLFPELQFSVYNLNQASSVTLSRLDIDAFLNAAALCACAFIEEQQHNKLSSPDRLPTLPADLINPYCTPDQEKWWSAAYKMYKKEVTDETGDTRQHLQRGLEVVRCIGNHGLHPTILVHLARVFSYRAKQLRDKNTESGDIAVLEARSEMYWSAAVPLLERLLESNQTIRLSNQKLFEYVGKEMNNMERTHAIEEGKLLLAQKLIKDKFYEQAVDALKALKCPEASFEQGKIYKILADELIDSIPKESVTSEIRSQHGTLLTKAKNCFYLTLDRLRGPDVDPKHPLNSELCSYITLIENELKRVEPDNVYNDRNRNDCDDYSGESYSSAHSDEHPIGTNSLYPQLNNSVMHTPLRNVRRTPKQSSTPRHHDNHDSIRMRNEARPSPERLDAQIRQLVHAIEGLKEQNREQHRGMMSKLDELIKINSKKESQKPRPVQPPPPLPPVSNHNVDDDLYQLYNDEEFSKEWANYSNVTLPTSGRTPNFPPNIFTQAQRHPYSPIVYPQLQGYPYQGLPFPDPTAAMAMSMYPASAAAYNPINSLYRGGLEQQPLTSMQQMSESLLQQGLYGQKFGEYTQTQALPPLTQVQNIDATRNDSKLSFNTASEPPSVPETSILKETLTSTNIPATTTARKVLPVNVVITTSDTLPTSTSKSPPCLSVTIPAHHRLGSSVPNDQNTPPHSYQISMPSQPMIPTTVILPPLSETMTITSPVIKAQVAENQNNSILSTGSRHSFCSDVTEVEHDPIPDFAPIIPLPDEVPVTTGEENEEELYCARAKLFRFVDKEWKERGIGNVKLLKNAEGKIRLLMRREQVHKICANHMLRKDMELTSMPNNDKAYMWVANDFADEEVRLEKLCIKFKTSEEAANFKNQFDKAKNNLPEESAVSSKTHIVSSEKSSSKQPSKSEPTPFKPAESKLGGFTFTSSPIIQKPSSPTQKKEESKPSPFANFSFVKSSEGAQPAATGFNFGAPAATPVFSQDPVKVNLRRPHTDVYTEVVKPLDSEVMVTQMIVSLAHYPGENNSWHEMGAGIMKVLSDKISGKLRLLMNNHQQTKTLHNQLITPTLVFNLKDDSINWTSVDLKEKYLARFYDFTLASVFHFHLMDAIGKTSKPSTNSVSSVQKPLSELFKPATGSWECNDCYTRNTAGATKCIACDNPDSGVPTPSAVPPSSTNTTKSLSEMFKPAVGSWECKDCYTRNNAADTACVACQAPAPGVPATLPSEMFKPASTSWSCKGCKITNNQSSQYCVACDMPQDPSMPPKPKASGGFMIGFGATSANPTFTFGMPQNQTTPSKESTGFNFSFSKSSEKAVSSPISIFGSNKTTTPNTSGFLFGTQPPTTPPSSSGGEFTFGSPGKSFDFQFQAKSPPIKSPERPETSDDEQVEESDDVYFAPVIPLPDKVDVKTGEEEEEVVYSHRAKLFKYDTSIKEWKERGLGDIKLLRHSDTKKLRLVMRREQVLKICLNHAVTANLEITPKDDKTWMWTAGDYSEGEIEYLQFACRFKNSEIAEEFKAAIDNAFKRDSDITPVSKPKPIAKSSSLSDIEVVYEIKVTPEEKAAALKLQLPENFYAYKYKDDCPGCRGCRESDEPLFKSAERKPIVVKANDATLSSTTVNAMNNIPSKPAITTASTAGSGTKTTFGSAANPPIFGSTASTVDDPGKSTGFVFGQSTATKSAETGLENLKICSPSVPVTITTSLPSTNVFGSFGPSQKSMFGGTQFPQTIATTTTSSIFGAQPAVTTASGIFSAQPAITNASTGNIFGSCKPAFGGGDNKPVFGDSKPMFGGVDSKPVFGGLDSKSSVVNLFGSNKPPSANIFGGGASTTATNAAANSIFGQNMTSGSIFGGQSNSTPTFGSLAAQSNNQTTFGTQAVTPPATTSSSLFSETTNQFTSKSSFGNNATPAVGLFSSTAASEGGNIFGAKTTPTTTATTTASKESGKEGVSFLPTDSSLSFSALAANTAEQQPAFKTDPNFTFEGAGASVFGQKTALKTATKKASTKTTPNKSKNDDDEDGEEEDDNGEEHDPHFEPIIPLPDAIEVRTGEEDEEKVFCQRAKLFRYDQNTKEWKERGVGEMKLLHHPEHGTYRLLLRREQVHKIVCNMALNSEMKFLTLNSSDKAWMWFGMNYAEPENAEVEQLAVRFKSPELAAKFKDAVDKAQKAIAERSSSQDSTGRYDDGQPEDDYDDDYEGDEYADEDDEEDEEDEDNMTMFEKQVTLFVRNESENTWDNRGTANLKVIYDSDIFGARIVIESEAKEIVSETVISMDTTMKCEDTECEWAAIDYALEPPIRRSLKTVFATSMTAQEMYHAFEEGQECATNADIRE
ncbi:E3 SUMO-protein ligase RanBP2-like isoform X2 [Phymastichus coffea]|uniref:E3 SUMO-protein ligase RanBP2-like isoform X2 n=1 Tax=Phymastichus coffea TaxID=108790 RepID=UPI00273A7824|nr:E3 SUMO-protein ligase RanBP2-like isoform X2 [Phymastichus coffea]